MWAPCSTYLLTVPTDGITYHNVQVLLCWPRHLKTFPCISRPAVQQFGPSHIILPWNTYLPVPINHKLGTSILKGWVIIEGINLIFGLNVLLLTINRLFDLWLVCELILVFWMKEWMFVFKNRIPSTLIFFSMCDIWYKCGHFTGVPNKVKGAYLCMYILPRALGTSESKLVCRSSNLKQKLN